MKNAFLKILICALLALGLVSCATKDNWSAMSDGSTPSVYTTFESQVEFPAYYFGEDAEGYTISSFHDGNVILAKENAEIAQDYFSVPAEFSNGTVIISYSEDYYYNGKKRTGEYELVYFNIQPEPSFTYANRELFIPVNENDVIGFATADTGLLVRCKRLDEYLVSCSRTYPKYDGTYWYFCVESFDSTVPKFLNFQPVSSRTDEITFKTDGLSESLEHISCSGDIGIPNIYPSEGIRIKTQLSDYPEINVQFENNAEYIIRQQYLRDGYGNIMSLDVAVNLDGLILHVLFPDYFIDFLMDEYTLGDDIYLYAYLVYSLNGEMYLYGRDFQQHDPDEEVDVKKQDFAYANFGDNSLR